ncbi:alpha/beta hydrolase [Massilia norwichensis]|uniref:Alpha/beta fold hydrolase n=1 Tax=Massilia norwichensis TaxID=1442366 RepID=A0ABT2A7S2_9BURK|nr:alpha/beta fold hydrolase [Massilia norwichensis]MCS0590249.1 alpha/beta fold hydrolase [Massilia norwichensis]
MRIQTLLLSLCVLILLGAAATWLAGSSLIAVRRQHVGPAPWPQAQAVSLAAGPQMRVEGWYLAGSGRGAVLLLHGIRSDRRAMIGRARFLHAQGYGVLLADLPGQGESLAPAVTFGLREADGVRVALAWLRSQAPGQRIGVIGTSLGAASLVLCRDCPPVDAVVLESMYPTIEEAVEDRLRMRLGVLGKPLAKLLLWQLPLRLAIQPAQLHPIARLPEVKAPLLIAAGSADRHTTLAETQRLFAAAPEPKSLWIVDGAEHVDLHAYAPAEYERRIGTFLARHLR